MLYQLAVIILHNLLKVGEIGKRGELLSGYSLDEVVDGLAERIEGEAGGGTVGQVAFEPLPEPLDWIQFGAIRRQVHQHDICGRGHGARDMGRSIVQHEDMEALGIVCAKALQEHLEAGGIEGRQLQPKSGSAGRLDGGVEPVVLIDWGRNPDGLGPARADPASDGQVKTDAGFILTPQSHRRGRIGGPQGG